MSTWYRRSLWNYKGNREYTKLGYTTAKERFIAEDLDVDCADRHYVITGCNSGIGLEIAREVAKRGGVLHMVCRNFEAAKKARAALISNTGNDKIHLHMLDMAKPREVAHWAKEFAATHEKIHVLINNAGCMVHERIVDEDGIETNFAVNTLAVHIITMAFLPVLQRNEDARVVTVSSAGMLVIRLDPNDLMHENMEPFNGRLVYSQNKRQQVVMTLWYAQRYDNVHFSVMHPGWADTPSVRNSMPEFYEAMKDNLRTATEGADTAVWLAISKAAKKYPSGFFFQDRQPASTHLPLAWTKTSIEEENLLMNKLMILTQKVNGELPEAEANAIAQHGAVTNGLANGSSSDGTPVSTSSKVEEISSTLSAVTISESIETNSKRDDDVVDTKTKESYMTEQTLPKEKVEKSPPPLLPADKQEGEKHSQDKSDVLQQESVPQPCETKAMTPHLSPTFETENVSERFIPQEETVPEPSPEEEKETIKQVTQTAETEKVIVPDVEIPKQDTKPESSLSEYTDAPQVTKTPETVKDIAPEPATVEIKELVTEELVTVSTDTPSNIPRATSRSKESPASHAEDLLEVSLKQEPLQESSPTAPAPTDTTPNNPPKEEEQLLKPDEKLDSTS